MAEYLDKEAFKKSVEERYCKPCKAEKKDHNGCWCRACWVDDMLDEVECFQPAADVSQVVRCKDCKQGEVDDPDFPDQYYCHAGCGWNNGDFYCAYGEREEGADNG